MKKKLLWLDDIRNPLEDNWLSSYSPIGTDVEVIWCKSCNEAISYVKENGLPDAICFDHDLGLDNHIQRVQSGMSKKESKKYKQKELSGYDFAKFVVDYHIKVGGEFPKFNSQSYNPIGKENILHYLNNYIKTL